MYIFTESVLSRKTVAEAFWNYHIEDELRERCMIDTTAFRKEGDREKVMKEIKSFRRTSTYLHNILGVSFVHAENLFLHLHNCSK